jgi:hypothetical protein
MRELELVLDEMAKDSPIERASWEDVLERAQRSPWRSRRWVGAVAAGIAVLAAAPAFALGLGAFDGVPIPAAELSPHDLHVLSAMANGESVRIPSSRAQDITGLQETQLRRIAVRDDRAFFVAPQRGGGLCVAIGTADPLSLGQISCGSEFPSAARPLLDMSGFGGSLQQPELKRLQGFVADGITSVGVLTDTGVVAITAVENNVYSRDNALPKHTVRGIVALDEAGAEIYTFCIDTQGCAGRS